MPVVQMPDGQLVDMPDNPTPDQLEALSRVMPQPAAPAKESPSFLAEAAKAVPGSLLRGVTALPDLLGFSNPNPALIPSDIEYGQDQRISQRIPKPETNLGKAVGAVAEGVGAGVAGPGGFTRTAAAIGGAAGAGGEAAARMFGDNPLTRFLGGIVGGGVPAIATSIVPNAERMIRTSTKGVTPQDWRRAEVLDEILKAEGMPALKSQLLGEGSTLDDVVGQASSNQFVRPTLINSMRNVGPRTAEAVGKFQTQNLGLGVDERRDLLADIQRSAKAADEAAVNRSNVAYRSAMPEGGQYSYDYVEGLKADIIDLANSEKYGPGTQGGNTLKAWAEKHLTLPEGETMAATTLNNMVKDLNQLRTQEGWKGLPTDDLKRLLKESTPEFDAARQAKRAVMQADVNPRREGLAGQIMRMGGGPQEGKYTVTGDVVKMVFPADKAQPGAITKLASDIGGDKVGDLLREHLSTSLETALKGVKVNPQAPANFVEAVAGTPAQRRNVEAALLATARANGVNPYAVRNGFYNLMKALGTYKDVKISGGIDPASTGFEAGRSLAGGLIAPASRVGRFFWERATASTYQKIADIVTSPDGLKTLEKIARTENAKKKEALLRAVLASAYGSEANNPAPVISE